MPPEAQAALPVIASIFIAFVLGKLSGYREAIKDTVRIYEADTPIEISEERLSNDQPA